MSLRCLLDLVCCPLIAVTFSAIRSAKRLLSKLIHWLLLAILYFKLNSITLNILFGHSRGACKLYSRD
ncbi:MAG: hypothetical protein A4E53_01001 [Pelotomaculum sp. PtaB.Bin104]|nr:MAG: hypothetical protein A4E53_01001 [Pelotomaculum sp. PtaB.Bin104]